MTDKQIIDGVDVSGCKHYKHNDKNSGWSSCTSKDEEHIHAVNPLCCEKKDCLYKQHKRKEQECEELKKGYSELTDIVSPYMDDFTGYNEELGGFDIVLCVKELMEQLDQLKSENKHLNDLLNQALKELEKTRGTLTEIKELCKRQDLNQGSRCIRILQKISEVENETINN